MGCRGENRVFRRSRPAAANRRKFAAFRGDNLCTDKQSFPPPWGQVEYCSFLYLPPRGGTSRAAPFFLYLSPTGRGRNSHRECRVRGNHANSTRALRPLIRPLRGHLLPDGEKGSVRERKLASPLKLGKIRDRRRRGDETPEQREAVGAQAFIVGVHRHLVEESVDRRPKR